jgi:hypothetical protein
MEPRSKSPAGILAILGGALLVIGSILPWAKVSIDIDRLASVLGVDPAALAGADLATSQNISGMDADGVFTLIAGIVVLVCAGIYLANRANATLSVLILLGGLLGAGVALWDLLSKDQRLDDALADAGPDLEALGLTADTFKEVFSITFTLGIYICVVGGLLALIAGAMALRAKPEPVAATSSAGTMGAGGFGSASPATSTVPPPSSTPTSPASTPTPPASTPPLPPSEDPPTATP